MFTELRIGNALSGRFATPLQRVTAVLVAFVLILQAGFAPISAQVSGTTYTSPQFGYSVTWDDSWFVMSEETQAGYWDLLVITNGITTVAMYGESNVYPTFESGLATFVTGFNADPAVSEFAPMRDDEGNVVRESDENGALAAFTYTYTLPDATEISAVAYMEVRGLDSGQVLFGYSANMPLAAFETQRTLPGVTLPDDEPTVEPDEIVSGEPAPVFISGTWRVGIATSAVRETFAEIGLKQKSGKEWMLIVLDVTNWSEQDGVLSARDFTIRTGAEQKPVKIARSSMNRLADYLGTAPFAANLTMAVGAGETVRITLAFVVPAGTPSPMLAHKGTMSALEGSIEPDLQASELPASAAPPILRKGEIVSASDGNTIRVMFDGEQRSTRIKLLGVNPPTENSCFANAAEKSLDDLAGSTVLVEEDTAITGGTVPSRYVWLIHDDGTRTLLNQQLIAEGSAYAASLPADARFGAWFQSTAHTAEESEIGLWAGCSATASGEIGIAATPAAVPTDR
jgi:endonuclease YncB( thermonuclease family)